MIIVFFCEGLDCIVATGYPVFPEQDNGIRGAHLFQAEFPVSVVNEVGQVGKRQPGRHYTKTLHFVARQPDKQVLHVLICYPARLGRMLVLQFLKP